MMSGAFEKVNGILLPRLTPKRWEELKNFRLEPDEIFIVAFPKSGTTWMQQIVKLLRNGGRKDDVLVDRSIPWLEMLDTDSTFAQSLLGYTPDMANSSDILSPRVFKSHFPYELVPGGLPHETPAKYIYVMRNPKDVLVSSWHHSKNIHNMEESSWDKFVTAFLSMETMFGGWFDHVLGWWKHKDAPNILLIKYEDMKFNPHTSIRTIAEFIGIECVTEELVRDVVQNSSFTSMKEDTTCNYSWHKFGHDKSRSNEFIRKGEVGNWRQYFSDDLNKRFDEMLTKKLGNSGLTFQFE